MSYAIETSPGEVKLAGSEVVKSVLETAKTLEPLFTSKNLPVVIPVEVRESMVPVVSALATIDCPIPVVNPEYVCKNCVPLVEAEELSVNNVPDVVLVSAEEEVMLANVPPLAMMPVVWLIFSPLPEVSALTSIFIKVPVVKLVDCKSMTPAVFAPLPNVVAVLLVRAREDTVLEVSVTSTEP